MGRNMEWVMLMIAKTGISSPAADLAWGLEAGVAPVTPPRPSALQPRVSSLRQAVVPSVQPRTGLPSVRTESLAVSPARWT